MARTLYMNDGSMELVFGSPQDTLQKVIYERLGRDCEELYKEIIEGLKEELTAGDDYEKIADGQRTLLQDTQESLEEALALCDKPRLNKAELRNCLQSARDEINKNL